MDKKLIIAMIVAAVVLVGFLGVNTIKPKESPKPATTTATPQSPETTLKEEQILACNAADQYNTCKTKLPKLVGLVTWEDCCKKLKKCCEQ